MERTPMSIAELQGIYERYREAYKKENWGEARKFNQMIYEDLFLTYQNILRMIEKVPYAINPTEKVLSKLDMILKEGIFITTQQNTQEEK